MPSQKLSAADARTNVIKRHKLKKTLKEEMSLLRESTDEEKVRQYYEKLIRFYVVLAFEAVGTNLKEIEILTHLETHKPAPPPEEVVQPLNNRKGSRDSLRY